MKSLLLYIFLCSPIFLWGQSNEVQIIQDYRINELVEKHIAINKKVKKRGYRIQIFFDSGNQSKSAALKAKSDFLTSYPQVSAYIIFESPFYKVRVGNFRNRIEAYSFLNTINARYPDAYIVKDPIEYPSL